MVVMTNFLLDDSENTAPESEIPDQDGDETFDKVASPTSSSDNKRESDYSPHAATRKNERHTHKIWKNLSLATGTFFVSFS